MTRVKPDGTHDHPYSALNLRLALAGFGLVFAGVLAVISFAFGLTWLGWLSVLLIVVTVIDLVVIVRRRRERRRAEHGASHSLFE
ncbi:DUF6343 family protein [Catellatospora bangladeshensis]|uniref:Uncharacterized protein n=1 Tax=Catellatospora bangladeshensis TaxID=310355 RepID=A0A8J3JLS0_9ACTN|nr:MULTISPECIES: DUF6343 family protein [Catellatospora]BCJ73949.1 hypothetical protein CS0771_34930 [Catellatospora sp. IY07-71]GIF84824.1 hypothetical protein Cba03nite_61730 [Catellatospora bangladeshensis]